MEILYLPFGQLLDLIAIEQIKNEGAELETLLSDEDIIPIDLR